MLEFDNMIEEMFIQVENGVAISHPFSKNNLMYCYGEIPSNFEPYKKTKIPNEIWDVWHSIQDKDSHIIQSGDYDTNPYQKVDGVWVSNWHIKNINESDKKLQYKV